MQVSKAKITVSILMALALLLALVTQATLAATDSTTGSVTVGNSTPVIGTPTIDALVPNSDITITVPVTDANTLDDISEVWVVMAFDPSDTEAGLDSKGVGDTVVDTLAIVEWTPGGSFSLVGPSGTSWAIVGGGCSAPTLTNTTGDFVFEVTVSPVARYAVGGSGNDGWDIYIKVTDKQAATDEDGPKGTQGSVPLTLVDKSMAAYASVSLSDASVSFGSLSPGASQQPLTTPASGNYTTTSVANKAYDLQIQTEDWTGSGHTLTLDADGSPATDSFSIEADDDGTVADAQFLSSSATTVTGHGSDGPSTTEAGDGVDISLWVTLGSAITYPVQYNGSITMTVIN
jgi:hypothetical protein